MLDKRPFDAKAVYLTDRDAEMAKWRTISLVTAMREILEGGQGPRSSPAETLEIFSSVAQELTRRGLDAVALIRYGMWHLVLSNLISHLTASRLAPHWGVEPVANIEDFDHEAWARILKLPSEIPAIEPRGTSESAKEFVELLTPIFPAMISWIRVASLKDMTFLVPPPGINPLAQEDLSQFLALHNPYRWMVDYFSTTFYR
ncbi:hypothetical protein OUY22_27065, partial [Nonomuraea sp. MCN248]